MSANILITGASSGLGAALALAYASPGATLFLGGRDEARLGSVAAECRARGAVVVTRQVDVTDQAAMENWVLAADDQAPLTLVIANAGISGGTGGRPGETAQQARAIFATNLEGVLNCLLPLMPRLQARKSGQIAIMASLAGFRGMPSAPAYAASKAAVKVWGEGLRGWLQADQVGVSVICPGFVETAMTARNRFPMPFLLKPDKAAEIMKRGIDSNRARISFPWPLAAIVWLIALLPPAWVDPLLSRTPKKD